MSQRRIFIVLGACALAGCREEVITIPTGFRGEARANPMLAAQRTLDRLGVESEVQYGLSQLPPHGETLFTEEGALALEGPILDEFLGWVDAGGTAVVCLDGFAIPTGLLGALGADEDDDFFFSEEEPEPWEGRGSALLERLDLERVEHDDFWRGFRGFDLDGRPKDGLFDDGEDLHQAVDVPFGSGEITVFPSGHLFNNQNLGEQEHAELLFDLAGGGQGGGRVVIALVESPGLWGLLTTRAPFALAAALALLLIWLWRSWPRFGPVEGLGSLGTAGFQTHAGAVGRLLWEHDRGPTLLHAARQVTRAELRSRFAWADGLDPEGFCHVVAEQTGDDPRELERALYDEGPLKPDQLVAVQHTLTRLRTGS